MAELSEIYQVDYTNSTLIIDYGTFQNDKEIQQKNEKHTICEIQNCQTTIQATKILSSENFQKKFSNFIVYRVIIDEKLNLKNVQQPRNFEFDSRKNIIITYESKDLPDKIIFWKNSDSEDFHGISLIDENISISVSNFVLEFIITTLQNNLSVTSNSVLGMNLSNIYDSDGYNLLFTAIMKNKSLHLIKELLKIPFDINEVFSNKKKEYDETLIVTTWLNGNLKVVLELLNANSKFPKGFQKNKDTAPEILEFLNNSQTMHEAIKENKMEDVKSLHEKFPHLRYFLNEKNESAAKIAFQCNNDEIFKLLSDLEITFTDEEELNIECDEKIKEKFTDLISKSCIEVENKHLLELITRSVVNRGGTLRSLNYQLIQDSLIFLNSIEEIKPILQVASTAKNMKIHFDFRQSSVKYMNLSVGANVRGLFVANKYHLYIAGKLLLDKQTKNEGSGIISHELLHFSLHLIFRNERLPYAIDDDKNKQIYEKIVADYIKKKGKEKLIDAVYDDKLYDSKTQNKRSRELIVRVPQLLAIYHGNETKISEKEEEFKELFHYYYTTVRPALEEGFKVLEKLSNKTEQVKYSDLTKPLKAAIQNSEVFFQGNIIKLNNLITKEEEEIYNKLESDQIKKILNENKKILISEKQFDENKNYFERRFLDSSFDGEVWKANFNLNTYELTNDAKEKVQTYKNILKNTRASKLFLLADHAGSGKSTTLKYIYTRLKTTMSAVWTYFIDLHLYLDFFEKIESKLMICSEVEELEVVTDILIEIMGLMNPLDDFEKTIFKSMLMRSKVMLLYDGVDEISPTYNEFFMKLVSIIKSKTTTVQWITTRLQDIENMQKKFNHVVYKLLPLNHPETEKYIVKILEAKNIRKEIQQKEALEEIKKVNYSLKLIDNPLMLEMITELHIQGRLNKKDMNYNRYLIYEAMMDWKKEILAKDKGWLANYDSIIDSKFNIYDILKFYALKLSFKNEFEDFSADEFLNSDNYICKNFREMEKFKLFKTWKKRRVQINWTSDAIARTGLLIVTNFKTGAEFSGFAHKTFEEFFVAKFVVDCIAELFEEDDEEDLSSNEFKARVAFIAFIIASQCERNSKYELIWNFICDYYDGKKQVFLFKERFLNLINEHKLGKFTKKMINQHEYEKIKKFNDIFLNICEHLYNTRELDLSLLDENLSKGINEEHLNEFKRNCCHILEFMQAKPMTYFQQLFSKHHEHFNDNFFYQILHTFDFLNSMNCLYLTGYNEQTFNMSWNDNEDFILKYKDEEKNENYVKLSQLSDEQKKNFETEIKHLKSFSLLLSYITQVNVPTKDLEKFVKFNMREIINFVLRSQNLTDKVFEIFKIIYKTSKMEFSKAMGVILNEMKYPKIFPPFLIKNINFFFEKLEKFLDTDLNLIKTVICHNYKFSKIITLSITNNISYLRDFCARCYSNEEICNILQNQIRSSTETFFNFTECIKYFDEFCVQICPQYESFFQFMFCTCNSFYQILNLFIKYYEVFKINWVNYIGYPVYDKNMVLEIYVLILLVADKYFVIQPEMIDYQKGHLLKEKDQFISFLQIFSLFETNIIPPDHSQIFFKNNFMEILKLLFEFHQKAEFVFKILEKEFADSKEILVELIESEMIKVLWTEKLFLNNNSEFTPTYYFFYRIEKIFNENRELMRRILLIKYNYEHPLILLINFEMVKAYEIMTKYLTVEEIYGIVFHKTCESIEKKKGLKSENFESFISSVLPYGRCIYMCLNLNTFTRIIEPREYYLNLFNSLKIFILLLEMIEAFGISKDEIEKFFTKNLVYFMRYIFRNTFITNRIFKIFDKHFKDEKEKVVRIIANGLKSCRFFGNVFLIDEYVNNSQCKDKFDKFLTKLKEWLQINQDDHEVTLRTYRNLKQIFAEDEYKEILLLSINFNFTMLIDLYLEICSTEEILEIFIKNMNLIVNCNKSENFKRFFLENFKKENDKELLKSWFKFKMLKEITKKIKTVSENNVISYEKFKHILVEICKELGFTDEEIVKMCETDDQGVNLTTRTFGDHPLTITLS
ncbi:hypothetical protein PVAND_005121 [Polypedilum vanderplanki]|uniref:NACHT domain-containing protein n=1 Tax=Polypedilum vanderplanki TaxID=319348 RepID=A0A9J6C036_POLVA|nr:hypothetical protein PVAND_005121 [Polypedilum vanderplanki]